MREQPPEVVRALEAVARKHGGILMPDAVVDAARNPKSPLHSRFQWDDTKAAHAYRLEQARWLIRVCVRVIDQKAEVPDRVWVSLSTDRAQEGGYRSIVSVLSDADLRRQLLADAVKDMEFFTAKYQRLTELTEVIDAINSALALRTRSKGQERK